MRLIFFLTGIFIFTITGNSQSFTNSNLPIVVITTEKDPISGLPLEIYDNPKISANMKIIWHKDGSRNNLSDQNDTTLLNYNGKIGIELRGSASQTLPKKPYGLTTLKSDKITNNNVSILGMPKENDWILSSIAFDPSLIRDVLSYDLSRSIGQYASRCVYCELVINNDYKGLYVFMEKIKVDDNRVNIIKLSTSDNTLPNLSGGYLTKADKNTGGDPVAWSMPSYNGTVSYIHDEPKPSEITTQQNSYIYSQFTNLQTAMSGYNGSIINGYPSIIDIPSFVDYMLLSEFTSNADSYQFSTYFHKERNGKLRAGPIWDYHLTFGNDLFIWNLDRSHYNVWQFDNGDNTGSKFWKDLFNDPTFHCYLAKRWREINGTNQPFNLNVLTNKIDQMVSLIAEARVRDNNRWGTSNNYTQEISNMKYWIQQRINWMNSYLNNYQLCSNPSLPPLVITRINYHPLAAMGFSSEDLEFVEITNKSSDAPVNLTGLYFRELGFTYQFPANSSLGPNGSLFLAGNKTAFKQYYGTEAFGQFTRSLANKAENLVLADAYGNVIDRVDYQDTIPWPVEADGTGAYLQLKDINADNNKASNWTFSQTITLGTPLTTQSPQVTIFPNPVQNNFTIDSGSQILQSFDVFDISGNKLLSQNKIESNQIKVNILTFPPGVYLIKLYLKNREPMVQKITKT